MAAISTTSTLGGALHITRSFPTRAAYQDVGGKIAALISAVNILSTNLSTITVALSAANASGVTFSSLSGVAFTSTYVTISNFSTT